MLYFFTTALFYIEFVYCTRESVLKNDRGIVLLVNRSERGSRALFANTHCNGETWRCRYLGDCESRQILAYKDHGGKSAWNVNNCNTYLTRWHKGLSYQNVQQNPKLNGIFKTAPFHVRKHSNHLYSCLDQICVVF